MRFAALTVALSALEPVRGISLPLNEHTRRNAVPPLDFATSDVQDLSLQKRVPPGWTRLGWGGVSVFTAAVASEVTNPTGDLMDKCQDAYDASRGKVCNGHIYTKLMIAAGVLAGTFFAHESLVALNILQAAAPAAGAAKRGAGHDPHQGKFNYAALWDQVKPKDKEAWRKKAAIDGKYVHSVLPASDKSGLQQAIRIQYSHNETSDPHMYHDTNGTHGQVFHAPDSSASNSTMEKRDLFYLGPNIGGVKLDYTFPCANSPNLLHVNTNNPDLTNAMNGLASYYANSPTVGSIGFELDINNLAALLATFTIEPNNFDPSFVDPKLTPTDQCP